MQSRWLVGASIGLIVACARQPSPSSAVPEGARRSAPADGAELIEQMHHGYTGRWYRTLTFVQKTTFPDGHVETWYEALELPGKLRIDIAPLDQGKTVIFRNDSIYNFDGGKLTRSGPFVHPLLVLGFDVYGAPPSQTAARLRSLGFKLGTISQNTWQGRPVWVVGAAAGDSTTQQFWVDAERLVFVRLIERRPPPPNAPEAGATRVETLFNDYRPLGGGWVSPEVVFRVNGERRLLEEYRDMRADVELPPGLFNPARLQRATWME